MKTFLFIMLICLAAMPGRASFSTKCALYQKGHEDQKKIVSVTMMDSAEAAKQFPSYAFDQRFYYAVIDDGTGKPLIFEVKHDVWSQGNNPGFTKDYWTAIYDQVSTCDVLQETGSDRGKTWIMAGKNADGTWVDPNII